MDFSLILRRFKKRSSYYISIGIFMMLVIGIVSSLYYSALKIDYVWRWFRIPQYFVYQDQVEIRAQTEGVIESILYKDDKAIIRIKSDEETEVHTVPTSDVRVDEGDLVFPGDILATYKKWQTGILLKGLWLTLKVSVISIFFGILIGLFTGIARISSSPALKWSAVTYIELIRGSPLLVQIFIWYFVLGTLINNIIAREGFDQIPPLWFGVAALACFAGAYVAEMVRARHPIHPFRPNRSCKISGNDLCSVYAVYYSSPGFETDPASPCRPVHQPHKRLVFARPNRNPGIDQSNPRGDHHQPSAL